MSLVDTLAEFDGMLKTWNVNNFGNVEDMIRRLKSNLDSVKYEVRTEVIIEREFPHCF